MKKFSKLFLSVVAYLLVFSLAASPAVLANGHEDDEDDSKESVKIEREIEDIDEDEDEIEEDEAEEIEIEDEENEMEIEIENDTDELEDNQKKEWEIAKDQLIAEKDAIEVQKDAVEAEKDLLEAQYEAAKASGDFELAAQLMAQVQEKKQEMKDLKYQMHQIKCDIKEVIKNNYTDEELQELKLVADKLQKNKDIKVLPVENIIAKHVKLKFDTPPVIKEGRTLVPVRALSEAFGCDVAWNADKQEVTINKESLKIVLKISSNIVYVNGVEEEIDVSAEILNDRTVVPLRFIVEGLGLKISWDGEAETIEIEEDEALPNVEEEIIKDEN